MSKLLEEAGAGLEGIFITNCYSLLTAASMVYKKYLSIASVLTRAQSATVHKAKRYFWYTWVLVCRLCEPEPKKVLVLK